MVSSSLEELRAASEHLLEVTDECVAAADYNAIVDLFTEDCTYVEHAVGEMHGRETVRAWLVPLTKEPPNDVMTYTRDWVLFDEENGRVLLCVRTHLPDLGDGIDYRTTN